MDVLLLVQRTSAPPSSDSLVLSCRATICAPLTAAYGIVRWVQKFLLPIVGFSRNSPGASTSRISPILASGSCGWPGPPAKSLAQLLAALAQLSSVSRQVRRRAGCGVRVPE